MVLFFGLVFTVGPPFWKFFCRRPYLHIELQVSFRAR